MKRTFKKSLLTFATLATLIGGTTLAVAGSAFLEISIKVDEPDRPAAAAIYTQFKQPFMDNVPGALSKQLLMRDEDVQVLHGFKTVEDAQAYLKSDLFNLDVVKGLAPFLKADPEIRIYSAN